MSWPRKGHRRAVRKVQSLHINRKNVTTSPCPACGYEPDSANAIDGSGADPAVGDFSICLRCRMPLKFGYDYQLERLSQAELLEFKKLLEEIRSKKK